MNLATAAHLARRTPGRVPLLDLAFQRYDLHLSGTSGVEPADLERFLASRPSARQACTRHGLRRLDADLSDQAAPDFVADYASTSAPRFVAWERIIPKRPRVKRAFTELDYLSRRV